MEIRKETKINEMDIKDEFEFADSNASMADIAKKFQKLYKEGESGAVLITDNDEVIGLITEKEIIDCVAEGKNLSELNATQLMNNDYVEVLEYETLGEIMPIISHQYPNAIVVIDDNRRCIGFFSKNDYKDAMAVLGVYDETKEPETSDEWSVKGIALSSQGDQQEALNCYEKAVEKDADKEKGWSELAQRLEKLNKHKDAITCYNKVLTLNSENDEALTKRGNIYSKENTDNLAIQSYKLALSVNPENIEALMNMGLEKARIGEIEEAIEHYNKVQQLKGESADLWFKKGAAYDVGKKFENAIDCYNHAIEIDENLEDAWYNKGVALNHLDKEQETLECMKKILEINPNNESAREAITHFEENKAFSF